MCKEKTRGKPSQTGHYLLCLKKLEVFTRKEAQNVGVSPQNLLRLYQNNLIIKLSNDVYLHPDTEIDPSHEEMIIAIKKFGPQSVIGGLTALFYYNLIDQPAGQVWVIVPQNKKSTSRFYRCIRTTTDPCVGVYEEKYFRITNIERTLVEAFKYATKIGLETAIKASHSAIKQRLTTPAKIIKQARELGLESTVSKYWEILITV